MSDIFSQKKAFRKKVVAAKKSFSAEELSFFSEEAVSTLELTEVFQTAKIILAYHSLPDEVCTHNLLKKYHKEKTFLLPVVQGDDLILKTYCADEDMPVSSYGIQEPCGEIFSDYNKIDMVLVPGVAFDRKLNRMGRGKGFYDRLLPKIKSPKVGIGFDFQLFDAIPAAEMDIKMNMIVCENEIVVE